MKFLKFLKGFLVFLFIVGLLGLSFFVWYEWVRPVPEKSQQEDTVNTQVLQEDLLLHGLTEKENYKFVVVINPSHGGTDTGEKSGELLEKDITLAIANKIKSLNTNPDIGIFLTRQEDVDPGENTRREFLEKMEPDLFIDIHVGKKPQDNLAGTTVHYVTDYYNYQVTNVGLADIMERNVVTKIEGVAAGIYEDTENKYPLLKGVGCPSVSVEVGCLAGPVEGVLLGRENYQENIATGMLNAVYEVYKKVK